MEQLERLRHDLRSSLVVVSGFARLLAEQELTEEQRRDYAGRIEQAAADALRRIDEALA